MNYQTVNHIAIIQVTPEVIGKNQEIFIDEFEKIVQAEKSVQAILLNFRDINVINSQSLGLMVALHKIAESHQKGLGFCHLNEVNLEVMRLSQLDKILKIYKTEKEGLEALK